MPIILHSGGWGKKTTNPRTTWATNLDPVSKNNDRNHLPFYNFAYIFLVYFLVENDPHFIIYLPKSQKNICFNIDSEPGKILSLVSDPESGNIKADYIIFELTICMMAMLPCDYLGFLSFSAY